MQTLRRTRCQNNSSNLEKGIARGAKRVLSVLLFSKPVFEDRFEAWADLHRRCTFRIGTLRMRIGVDAV